MSELESSISGQFKHPSNIILSGPTQCGKSTLLSKIIEHRAELFDVVPQRIVLCYGAYQAAYAALPNCVELYEGVPSDLQLNVATANLVILDDLMNSVDERIVDLFTKTGHHSNASAIHLVQNIFAPHKHHRTISLNSHYLILFKNPRDASSVSTLARQMYPRRSAVLQDAYNDATSSAHGYLLVDLRQETPEGLRLRTNILPTQICTVYEPLQRSVLAKQSR